MGHHQPPCRGVGLAPAVMLGIGLRMWYSASPSMPSSFPYIFDCLSLSLLFWQSLLYNSQFNISIRTRLISTHLSALMELVSLYDRLHPWQGLSWSEKPGVYHGIWPGQRPYYDKVRVTNCHKFRCLDELKSSIRSSWQTFPCSYNLVHEHNTVPQAVAISLHRWPARKHEPKRGTCKIHICRIPYIREQQRVVSTSDVQIILQYIIVVVELYAYTQMAVDILDVRSAGSVGKSYECNL